MWPWTVAPGANGPSSFTRNHCPNSAVSVSARQTRDTGARSSIVFSIRSVLDIVRQPPDCPGSAVDGATQPLGCLILAQGGADGLAPRAARGEQARRHAH